MGVSGVEITVSLLFSDVRGSTAMGERMRPTEFHAFLDHFYRLASDAIVRHEGLVDKIVGDEVIGLFFGGISGPNHPGTAIAAAVDLAGQAADTGATPSGPIPAGTAVHTGEAFVGASGPAGTVDDFTALGDVVNTTARLASAAGAGEVIVSLAAAWAAGIETGRLGAAHAGHPRPDRADRGGRAPPGGPKCSTSGSWRAPRPALRPRAPSGGLVLQNRAAHVLAHGLDPVECAGP